MLVLKLLSLSIFIASWLYSRSSEKTSISDVFVVAFLTIIAPPFLFNPSGRSILYDQKFSPDVVLRAEIGVTCALLMGITIFAIRKKFSKNQTRDRIEIDSHLTKRIAWSFIVIGVLVFAIFMAFSEFRNFRFSTMRFALADLSGPEYIELRVRTYSNTFLLDGILGRLRYTVFPILYVTPLIIMMKYRIWTAAILFSTFFLLSLPMSLSKLPIVFFIGYFVTTFVVVNGSINLRQLIASACITALSVVALLSILYVFQYWGAFQEGSVHPLKLAIERIWGEPYSVILRYFSVYPDIVPYTGVSGINLLAKIIGTPPRLPELEVARLALGPNSGSNPGIFFVAGYASFGFMGLTAFSAVGFMTIWLLDEVGNTIKTKLFYLVYVCIMPINCLFLLQVALQTSLLTYGLALIPAVIITLDMITVRHYMHQQIKLN